MSKKKETVLLKNVEVPNEVPAKLEIAENEMNRKEVIMDIARELEKYMNQAADLTSDYHGVLDFTLHPYFVTIAKDEELKKIGGLIFIYNMMLTVPHEILYDTKNLYFKVLMKLEDISNEDENIQI